MYQHVPSIHTRACERLPAPGRITVDPARVALAPAVAYALALAAPRPQHAVHLLQRLARDGDGALVLAGVAVALALA